MIHDVDIVVIGGSSAGVAAAAEAAKAGASVFLAAPHPYLGEDLCATYRLWLEHGETPRGDLARTIFAGEPRRVEGNRLPVVAYTADREPNPKHRDITPPKLSDGRYHHAPKDSVQFDDTVTLTADLGEVRGILRASVRAFQRPEDFVVASADIAYSRDGVAWSDPVRAVNPDTSLGSSELAVEIGADLNVEARYLRFVAHRADTAERLLIAELQVEAPIPEGTASTRSPEVARPMRVKKILDEALLGAGVPFLFQCLPVDVLRDGAGAPAGVVIANRSGRQAVRAKVVIDATPRAAVARMAGAEFHPFPPGVHVFRRAVVGGEPVAGDGVAAVARGARPTVQDDARRLQPVIEYDLPIPMEDGSFPSFARAEQIARDKTWTRELVDASETLFLVPPDPVVSRAASTGAWPGAEAASLDAFRPKGVGTLWILGGCAEMPREAAAAMLRPHEFIELGARIGREAAAQARAMPSPGGVAFAASEAPTGGPELAEDLSIRNPRFAGLPVVVEPARGLPAPETYDVIVVGGGTGGAPAAIGAARQGARTLVIESIHGLGGVGTLGQIAKYYHGYRFGFTEEIDKGVMALAGEPASPGNSWRVEHKSEWLRREIRAAGGDIWFGAIGCGALVENGAVRGVAVATPHGRIVVRAETVIDGTGNSDVAAAAGAECVLTGADEIAVQGTGLPPRSLTREYINTDYTFVDETDIVDVWRAFVVGRDLFEDAYDMGRLIDTRERRRIVGDVIITPTDMFLGRTWPDTIALARSNFDSHGYTIHPIFKLRPPDKASVTVNVPYRALLPRGLDRILVIGLGISAHRDALPVLRMQPDIQNHGYAAGVAAAWTARLGGGTRDIDLKALQRHLADLNIVPESAMTDDDNLPLPPERVEEAVRSLPNEWAGLEVVVSHADTAMPLLRAALADAGESARLVYAHTLGMLGDPSGADVLAAAVTAGVFEGGWDFRGMGQFGANLAPIDSYTIALGSTRSPVALGPLLDKARALDASVAFSHHRALALALEALGDSAAAPVLAEVLRKPGMSGHAKADIHAARERKFASRVDTEVRRDSLREIGHARALYRLGDHEGLGEFILKSYADDLHGHYARHARAVLSAGPARKR